MIAASEPQFNPRWASRLLALSMLFTGASGLVNEYVLATVSTYILGNSIEQFSIIIALMMLMMGIGGALQKFLPDDALIEKFLGIEILLALCGGFAPLAIYTAFAYLNTHFALILYGFVMAIGLLIGFEVPLLMRINQHYAPKLESNLAAILSADFIGSFLGALLWTYVLLKFLPLTEISFVVASCNFGIAVGTYLYFQKAQLKRTWPWGLAISITALALSLGYLQNRDWNVHLEQRLYDDPIVFRQTTRYQHLVMTYNAPIQDYRLYINGNTQFSSLDEDRYHELLVHPALSLTPRAQRVLILGGGDGLALREIRKYPQLTQITLVDLDPAMVQIASQSPVFTRLNQNAFADARLHIQTAPGLKALDIPTPVYETTYTPISDLPRRVKVADVDVYHMDAERFIREIPGTYDVIIIDLPDPNSIELSKLYSREFYKGLQNKLTPEGLLALQATSPYHAKEAFLCIGRTLKAAGWHTQPYHDNIPSFGDWGWYLGWTQANPDLKMPLPLKIQTQYLTPERFQASMSFGKSELNSQESTVNSLMYPHLLHYYLDAGWKIG